MWWIIVISIIGGLILLGVLISLIPFDLTFRFESYGRPTFNLSWAWFFGLLRRDISSGRRKPKKPKERKFSLRRSVSGIRSASEFIRIKGLVNQLVKLIKGLIIKIKIKKLEADFLVGLGDPAETFYLFAITESLNRFLHAIQPYPVSIHTSFVEPVFEGYAYGTVRIYPVRMIPPAVRFMFSLPVLKLTGKAIAYKWKRNR